MIPIANINHRTLRNIIIAGIFGEIVLEFIAWVIAPPLLGVPMRPHLLILALVQAHAGVAIPTTIAVGIHLALGLFVMPSGYVLGRNILRLRSWLWVSIAWGVVLWLVAQAILAPLTGRPMFLAFSAYSWASLLAHVIYAIVVAFTFERLQRNSSTLSVEL